MSKLEFEEFIRNGDEADIHDLEDIISYYNLNPDELIDLDEDEDYVPITDDEYAADLNIEKEYYN